MQPTDTDPGRRDPYSEPAADPSVTRPIGQAIERARDILFRPFDLTKWLTLGFCAFLAQLGDSGGNANYGFDSETDDTAWAEDFGEWIDANMTFALTMGALILLGIVILIVLFAWLKSRGRFMFLDGVVRNRGAVVEPWHEFRAEGNSLFRLTVLVGLTGFGAMLLCVGVGALFAWPDIQGRTFGGPAQTGLIVGGTLFVIVAIAFGLADLILKDFVAPAMYARRVSALEGWQIVRSEVLAPHFGAFVLYVLMTILIAIAIIVIVVGLTCVTLCVAGCLMAIPYVGTVLLLPIHVFRRAYPLYFLEQLGGSWRLFDREQAEVVDVFE